MNFLTFGRSDFHIYVESYSLNQQDRPFDLAVDAARLGLWVRERDLDGKLRYWLSPHWRSALGYSPDDDIDLRSFLKKWVHPADLQSLYGSLKKHLQGRLPLFDCRYRLKTRSGYYIWVHGTGRAYRSQNGRVIRFAGSHTAITEEQRRLDFYETLLDTIPSLVFVKDEKLRFIYANKALAQALQAKQEDLIGKTDADFILHKSPEAYSFGDDKVLHTGQSLILAAESLQRPNGGVSTLATVKVPFYSEHGADSKRYVLGIATDISEFKRQEALLEQILSTMPQPVCVKDPHLRIIKCNESFALLLGLPSTDNVIGSKDEDLLPEEIARKNADIEKEVILRRQPVFVRNETFPSRQTGAKITVDVSRSPLFDSGRHDLVGLLVIYHDVTERTLEEEKVRSELKIKEGMLREIHHRVKNNLNAISSLLSLQARNYTGANRGLFIECQNRIRTMALIHEQLYSSIELDRVRISTFFSRLIQHLVASYQVNPTSVRVHTDVDDVLLDVDIATPCGLLINELVSNSFKHGFGDGRLGLVVVSLKVKPSEKIVLSVSDDGVGLPSDFSTTDSKTLGLKLVFGIAERQLEGVAQLTSNNGTRFQVEFPYRDTIR